MNLQQAYESRLKELREDAEEANDAVVYEANGNRAEITFSEASNGSTEIIIRKNGVFWGEIKYTPDAWDTVRALLPLI